MDANTLRRNQPGYDVLAIHDSGRQLRVAVKSISDPRKKHDFAVGGVWDLADVYAFVDTLQPDPWPVYLAGAVPVQDLAMARHKQWTTDRQKLVEKNDYNAKVSIRLLERIGSRERWFLLDGLAPSLWPIGTDDLLDLARADAPPPRG